MKNRISVFLTALTRFGLSQKGTNIAIAIGVSALVGLGLVGYSLVASPDTTPKITSVKKTEFKDSAIKNKPVTTTTEKRKQAESNEFNNTVPTSTGIEPNEVSLYRAGVALIKKHEGLYLHPYYCSAKVLTIGWGHTYETRNGKLTAEGKSELRKHINGITPNEAQRLFVEDFKKQLDKVTKLVHPTEREHLLALASLMYNAGEYGMMGKGTAVGESYIEGAADEDIAQRIRNRYVPKTKYEKGIKKRRANEAKMYLNQNLDKMLPLWETEVNTCLRKWLTEYNCVVDKTTKSRMNSLPKNTRSKIELNYNQISNLLK